MGATLTHQRLGGLEAGPLVRSWHSRRERTADQLLHPASGWDGASDSTNPASSGWAVFVVVLTVATASLSVQQALGICFASSVSQLSRYCTSEGTESLVMHRRSVCRRELSWPWLSRLPGNSLVAW